MKTDFAKTNPSLGRTTWTFDPDPLEDSPQLDDPALIKPLNETLPARQPSKPT